MIYLDNSATTNPKPQVVKNAVSKAMNYYSFNSGRGGYKESVNTSNMIFTVREKIADMFSFLPQNIAFVPNCTFALNYAIKGIAKPGDHFIISNLEHNAVVRPIYSLYEKGIISYDAAKFSYDKEETINNFKSLIKANTKAIVCMHASNVFGCVFPIKEIGKLAHDNGILFIVDAAQSAGVLDIDADRLESGTLNNVAICGLAAGIDFVNSKKIDNIYNHEKSLMNMVYKEMSKNENVTLYTPDFKDAFSAPILSFNFKDYPSEKTASLLAQKNIATRAGFHCSKLAHEAFNTNERGTVRISPSVFTNFSECEIFINTLKKL